MLWIHSLPKMTIVTWPRTWKSLLPRCRPIISNVCTEIIQIWTTASWASSHSAPQSTRRVVPWRAAHLHGSVPLHELLVLPRLSKAFDPSSPGWLLSSLRKLTLSLSWKPFQITSSLTIILGFQWGFPVSSHTCLGSIPSQHCSPSEYLAALPL